MTTQTHNRITRPTSQISSIQKVDANGHIIINGMVVHISSLSPGDTVHITCEANRSHARAKGVVECLTQIVAAHIAGALRSKEPQYANRLQEWECMDRSMELLILRLFHATPRYGLSTGVLTSRPVSPVRRLTHQYLLLQSQEPETPVAEILRRMMREADASQMEA